MLRKRGPDAARVLEMIDQMLLLLLLLLLLRCRRAAVTVRLDWVGLAAEL
jgi:hypothetical protein